MPTTLQQLLPILNLPCGDVLKAHLLAHFHPDIPKLNPMWLQGQSAGPRSHAEVAAAATREAIKGLPPAERLAEVTKRMAAEDKLAEVVAAHKPQATRLPDVEVSGGKTIVLVTEPSSARMRANLAQVQSAQPTYPSSFEIDGEEWVTIKEAAQRLNLPSSAVYYQCTVSKVPNRAAPQAKHESTKVYLWNSVQECLKSRKKYADK